MGRAGHRQWTAEHAGGHPLRLVLVPKVSHGSQPAVLPPRKAVALLTKTAPLALISSALVWIHFSSPSSTTTWSDFQCANSLLNEK